MNKSARDALCLKCKTKEWVDIADDPSPEELMKVVLNRIKEDASQNVVFMEACMYGSFIQLGQCMFSVIIISEEGNTEYKNLKGDQYHNLVSP